MPADHADYRADPEMLRRAAEACRNILKQSHGNTTWFTWVPTYLNRLAEQAERSDGLEG